MKDFTDGSLNWRELIHPDDLEDVKLRFREAVSKREKALRVEYRIRRDCFREIKTMNPHVRALLSSGFSLDGSVQEIMDEGIAGFIQKPYRLEVLSDAVARAIRWDHWLLRSFLSGMPSLLRVQ